MINKTDKECINQEVTLDVMKWVLISTMLFLLATSLLVIVPATEEKEASAQQLTEERAKALEVASKITVPHGAFLVSEKEILWITRWNVKEKDTILASLESGMGVIISGVIFDPESKWNRNSISIISAKHLAGKTVVQPSDCNYMQILAGLNNGIYSYSEGLPKCE